MTRVVAEYSGLSPDQIEGVALIYHFRGDNQTLMRSHLGGRESKALGGHLISVGTGDWDLTDNTVVTGGPEEANEAQRFTADALSRGLSHAAVEIGSTDRYGLSYGGWMELSHATEESFAKAPYALKFWATLEDGSIYTDDPLVFSYYVGNDLGIIRIFFDGPSRAPILRYWRVHDFLGRPAGRPPSGTFPFAPMMTKHLVKDRKTGLLWSHIRQSGEPSGINCELIDGKPHFSYDEDLVEFLRTYDREKAPWSVGPNPLYLG